MSNMISNPNSQSMMRMMQAQTAVRNLGGRAMKSALDSQSDSRAMAPQDKVSLSVDAQLKGAVESMHRESQPGFAQSSLVLQKKLAAYMQNR